MISTPAAPVNEWPSVPEVTKVTSCQEIVSWGQNTYHTTSTSHSVTFGSENIVNTTYKWNEWIPGKQNVVLETIIMYLLTVALLSFGIVKVHNFLFSFLKHNHQPLDPFIEKNQQFCICHFAGWPWLSVCYRAGPELSVACTWGSAVLAMVLCGGYNCHCWFTRGRQVKGSSVTYVPERVCRWRARFQTWH